MVSPRPFTSSVGMAMMPPGVVPGGFFSCYFFLVSFMLAICFCTAYSCDSRFAMLSRTRARFFCKRVSSDAQCLSSEAFASVMFAFPCEPRVIPRVNVLYQAIY